MIKKELYDELCEVFGIENKAKAIEKSAKYIKRWFSNGEWHYIYPPKYRAGRNRTKAKIAIANETKMITGIKPLTNVSESEIDEALLKLSLYANEGKLKCSALGNSSVYITHRTQEHIKNTKGNDRPIEAVKHKAKYIPFIQELLRNGKICEKSSSKKGVIYGIVGRVEYFDEKKQKKITEVVELAINYDEQKRKFVFSFCDYGIKKSLLNGRDSDNFLACPIADTETASITVYRISETAEKSTLRNAESLDEYVEKSIRILKECGAI